MNTNSSSITFYCPNHLKHSFDEFKEVINQSWSKTKWGNHHTNIQTMSDNGWLLYLLKDRTKVDLLSDIDWENTHIGLLK